MAINDWPKREQPREKLLCHGASTLSDAELLAIFLRTGVAGKTAVDLARDLLKNFGSLRALLAADCQTFCQSHGLGTAKFVQLQAILEIAKRHLAETLQRGSTLCHSDETLQYLSLQLRHQQREVFACLFLDTRHRIISYDELFFGTIHSTRIHPREIIKRALQHNAAAIILAHNHPSGIAEPSAADLAITKEIQQLLELLDIHLLDHIVIGDGQITSFAAQGLL